MRHAVEKVLEAALAKGLAAILVDDLHFADIATLEALRWLSASPALAGLRFGFASRPLEDDGAVARLLQDWLDDSHRPERIGLRLLALADIEALVATLGLPELASPGLAGKLSRHAGGQPFFMLETLKDVLRGAHDPAADTLPSPTTVQTRIQRRLRELPARSLDLLRVAAVAGIDLSVDRAAQLLHCGALALADPWADLEAANVLQGLRFAHALVHDGALRLVPLAVQRVLHAALAGLLARDALVPPGRVAEHWQAAERWADAAPCWHAAGSAARLAGRLVEQALQLERAAQCFGQAGNAAGEFDARHASLDGALIRNGGAAVLAALPRLQALAETPERHLKCRLTQAEALIDLGRCDEAIEAASAAVHAADDPPALLGDALCLQGMALAQRERFDEAIAAEQRAAEAARIHGPPRAGAGLCAVSGGPAGKLGAGAARGDPACGGAGRPCRSGARRRQPRRAAGRDGRRAGQPRACAGRAPTLPGHGHVEQQHPGLHESDRARAGRHLSRLLR